MVHILQQVSPKLIIHMAIIGILTDNVTWAGDFLI